MDQRFLLTMQQKPPCEVDKQTDINKRMAANSLERLSEVILPKSGKERQDAGDSEKGAVFQDGQEVLTYGNGIEGECRASVQLFESPNPQSLGNMVLLTIT